MTMDNHVGMPYHEADGYVSHLVSSATEKAIRQQKSTRRPLLWKTAAAAAVVLLLAGTGVTYYKYAATQQLTAKSQTSPVDEFLNNLTDEEVQMLTYYEVEEITIDEY